MKVQEIIEVRKNEIAGMLDTSAAGAGDAEEARSYRARAEKVFNSPASAEAVAALSEYIQKLEQFIRDESADDEDKSLLDMVPDILTRVDEEASNG